MKPVAVCNESTAGGLILPGPNNKLFFKGKPVAVLGCPVAPHGKPPHAAAIMIQATSKITVQGVIVCVQGDLASCGDPCTGVSGMSSN